MTLPGYLYFLFMEGRKSITEIRNLNKRVVDNPVLKTILEYAPVFVGVLTRERQFVLVIEQFFARIGYLNAGEGRVLPLPCSSLSRLILS
jgi:DNA-binding IclR family transcriptional regulator